MLDAPAEFGVGPVVGIKTEQGYLGAQERRVPRSFGCFRWKINQADAPRTASLDVIAERSCKIRAGESLNSLLLHQQLDPRGNGGLGKLELTNIVLCERNGGCQHPARMAVRKSSRKCDHSEVQSRSDGIHQTAATQAARSDVGEYPPMDFVLVHRHFRDGAGGSWHPHRDLGAFIGKNRPVPLAEFKIAFHQALVRQSPAVRDLLSR